MNSIHPRDIAFAELKKPPGAQGAGGNQKGGIKRRCRKMRVQVSHI